MVNILAMTGVVAAGLNSDDPVTVNKETVNEDEKKRHGRQAYASK